jgi:hypothetical protein
MRMAGPGSGEEGGKRVRETKTRVARGVGVGVVSEVGWSQKGRSLPNVRLGDELREGR